MKTVRTAGNVSRALQLIAERVPDFALLDIGLVKEKSFAIAERLEALGIPFAFISGYGADAALPPPSRKSRDCRNPARPMRWRLC